MDHRDRSMYARLAAFAALTAVLLFAQAGSDRAEGSELRNTPIVVAVKKARPSVVNIRGQKTVAEPANPYGGDNARRVNGMGTGVVIDERGYIITNYHVVDGVKRIQVTLHDGVQYYARVIAKDFGTDLAIIKIDAEKKLPVITIGTSSDLMTGETVIAVGNAFGYEHTVTRGIVSALHRTVEVSDSQRYEDLIQTDASINPGNSGGPLLNIDGEMIGVNVAVRAGAQGIGFAIPVDKVLDVAANLLSSRRLENKWHGLVVHSTRGNGPTCLVEGIEAESPAAQCGIQPGDVIKAIDNQPIARRLDLERVLLGRQVGETLPVSVVRDRKEVTVELVLASVPSARISVAERAWEMWGVRLSPVGTERLGAQQGRYRGGLAILEVRPDSPASRQGIQPGDILVGMHKWETVSLDNVAYILGRPELGREPLKFYIVRGKETLYGVLALAPQARD